MQICCAAIAFDARLSAKPRVSSRRVLALCQAFRAIGVRDTKAARFRVKAVPSRIWLTARFVRNRRLTSRRAFLQGVFLSGPPPPLSSPALMGSPASPLRAALMGTRVSRVLQENRNDAKVLNK
ncbi:hypothetical protein MRX96_032224 [Rhipicephalus microplus]